MISRHMATGKSAMFISDDYALTYSNEKCDAGTR